LQPGGNGINLPGMQTAAIELIRATDLADLWRRDPGLAVIDVRTAGEFDTVHARGARLHTLQELDAERFVSAHQPAQAPVYVLCKSGVRATQAAEKLLSAGLARPVVVEGGTDAWVAAGLPVERRGRKVLPLDQQMRTIAGVFIFLGSLLALTVNPSFVWVPLLMGCGLAFSGLTGICPMTGVLAKLPWNRSTSSCCSAK
jgi:rhodanese-related sulfurtransferase